MMPMCQNCTKKHCEQPPIEREDAKYLDDNDSDNGFDDVDRSESEED